MNVALLIFVILSFITELPHGRFVLWWKCLWQRCLGEGGPRGIPESTLHMLTLVEEIIIAHQNCKTSWNIPNCFPAPPPGISRMANQASLAVRAVWQSGSIHVPRVPRVSGWYHLQLWSGLHPRVISCVSLEINKRMGGSLSLLPVGGIGKSKKSNPEDFSFNFHI